MTLLCSSLQVVVPSTTMHRLDASTVDNTWLLAAVHLHVEVQQIQNLDPFMTSTTRRAAPQPTMGNEHLGVGRVQLPHQMPNRGERLTASTKLMEDWKNDEGQIHEQGRLREEAAEAAGLASIGQQQISSMSDFAHCRTLSMEGYRHPATVFS
jgi:hypothetical protein